MRKTVACGANRSYAIDEEGDIWCFGVEINRVQQITLESGLPRMIAVAAGCHHALFLDSAGKVWGFGDNNIYQLGISNNTDTIISPLLLPLPPEIEIVAITCGDYHSLLLDAEGFVWASGQNANGQVGETDGALLLKSFRKMNLQNISDIQAAAHYSMFLSNDGQVSTCGKLPKTDPSAILRVISVPPIRAMAAGVYFCLLVDFEGNVWGYGENDFGQLGMFPKTYVSPPTIFANLPPIRACGAGWNFSIFLGEDDSLWTVGSNSNGTLCNGTTSFTGNSKPVKIEAPPILAVSCGWNHSLFLGYNGDAWCTGEGKKLPFGSSECVSLLTKIEYPKQILTHGMNRKKNVKSARKI